MSAVAGSVDGQRVAGGGDPAAAVERSALPASSVDGRSVEAFADSTGGPLDVGPMRRDRARQRRPQRVGRTEESSGERRLAGRDGRRNAFERQGQRGIVTRGGGGIHRGLVVTPSSVVVALL